MELWKFEHYWTSIYWVPNILCPQNSASAISPSQKWWPTILEIEISCSQWEGSACTYERSSFSLFERGNRDFFCFVPLFPMYSIKFWSSSQIPIVFPITPRFYAICFAQSSTPLDIIKKIKFKGAHLSLLCNKGFKEVLLLGACPNVPKELPMGLSIWLL